MNQQIGLGAFGTFGEPFGYQQVFFMVPPLHTSLDLNTNAIEVVPGAELFAVKREVIAGVTSTCCCLYTYAKEPASNRGGTFIGACVVLRNSYLKGEDIYTLLKELHTDVVSNPKNIVDHTLQVQKAEQLTVTEPADFSRIKTTISSVQPTDVTSGDTQSKFLIQAPASDGADTKPVVAFFDSSIRYFTHTDTLYFTTDKRVISYASEKGIIPVVDWAAFEGYKKQIIQQQKEAAQKAEVAKKEKNQPTAKGTKSATKTAAPKNTAYGLLEPWTNVDANLSQEAFYKLVQNHNTLLQEYLKLSQQQLSAAPAAVSNGIQQATPSPKPRRRIKRKHLLITIFVLLALLLTTSILLLLRPETAPTQTVTAHSAADSMPAQNTIAPPPLVPLPNMELAKTDVAKLSKDSLKGKKLELLVDLLAIRNPKSIGEVYAGQKDAYAAALVQLNESCFRKDSIAFTCICDTLLHIPAFKK